VPIDVTPHLDPATCAVLNLECQENLIGATSVIPGLALAAEKVGLVDNVAALLDAARRVGAGVYYCADNRRAGDFAGQAEGRTRVGGGLGNTGRDWSDGHGAIVAGLTPHDGDVVLHRERGMTGFFTTGLDDRLRAAGVRTLVITGVSFNIAVLGTTVETMNLGYQAIVPSDCVASDPPEYAEWGLRYTIRNLALVTDSARIVEHWQTLPAA
jgi:nicotinamidase-related amidase